MKPLKIINSAYFDHALTILEMDVAPQTGTPKHYHTLFEETFEVLQGALFMGIDTMTTTLQPGESITVPLGSVHFFKNKTESTCRIRVTINPGNTDFEDAMTIYYGLQKDGLLSTTGRPKKISDLALFIHLTNSKMTGLATIAGHFFDFMANRAIKKGRLAQLRTIYTF